MVQVPLTKGLWLLMPPIGHELLLAQFSIKLKMRIHPSSERLTSIHTSLISVRLSPFKMQ